MLKTDLTDRVAVILDADTPFGRTLVKAFSDCGAVIAACHRPDAPAEDVAAALNACSTDCEAFVIDMDDENCLAGVRDAIEKRFGGIDILINNTLRETADVERKPLHEIDIDAFENIIRRGVKNIGRLTHYVTQTMYRKNRGIIVNVFNLRGIVSVANQSAAVSVSGALNGLSKMWGVEMKAANVRCNGVAVGVTEDEPKLPCGDALRFSHAAIERPCKLEEAANAVLFLAGDESSYITGIVLPVDGGISAGYTRSF